MGGWVQWEQIDSKSHHTGCILKAPFIAGKVRVILSPFEINHLLFVKKNMSADGYFPTRSPSVRWMLGVEMKHRPAGGVRGVLMIFRERTGRGCRVSYSTTSACRHDVTGCP